MNATRQRAQPQSGPALGPLPEMVDVAFALAGDNLPHDYAWPLFREVARILPWIAATPRTGILPIRGTRTPDGTIMITPRSRVVIRLPRDRVCSASAIERARLRIGAASVTIGEGTFRKHQPAATLYSPRVATGESDEVRFLAGIEEELLSLGTHGRLICGRRVDVELEEGHVSAFPVAVHELREADSLLLQGAGLGRGRLVGCGLLVPHRTIHAAE